MFINMKGTFEKFVCVCVLVYQLNYKVSVLNDLNQWQVIKYFLVSLRASVFPKYSKYSKYS